METLAIGYAASLVGIFVQWDHYLGYPILALVVGVIAPAAGWTMPASAIAVVVVLAVVTLGFVVNKGRTVRGEPGTRSVPSAISCSSSSFSGYGLV